MHVLVLFFFIVGCWCDIEVSVNKKGGYQISINKNIWLRSSRTALYVDNKWYSSDDNSLPLIHISTAQGYDPNLGNWNETQLIYDLVRKKAHTKIVGHIRQWAQIPGITFHLDTGNQILTNTVPLDMNQIRTVFPSFDIEQIDENDRRGYFTFEGVMAGDSDKHAGSWNSSSKVVHSGMQSGPVVIFNFTQRGNGDVLVLSPFSKFMATSLCQTNNTLEYGVMGSMLSIPASYNHSMIVFYSSRGINEGVREWGQAMQKMYRRSTQHRLSDLTNLYLGYYTDGGGYYYYNTEQEKNYEETILDIRHQIPLPIHYIQFDSWWYYKGMGDGVSQWTARPDIFPDGLQQLHRKLENIPIVAHNRYWAYDTIYKQNYSFILDKTNLKGLPIGNDSFWIDLFTQARQWGLVVYEQDWLNHQTTDFLPTISDIDIGRQWLMSMGEAAQRLQINIQYCMSLPRHILQALQISSVTQVRTSTDYTFHLENQTVSQWAIGISNMFADAIGLAPFKDVFWSTSLQPGAPYKPSPHEILPDREIAIATLSTGPVASGDGLNYTNVDRIMKCCRQDGLILKPDRPLTTINLLISDWALYNSVLQGELYSTRTTINDQTFYTIFASSMKQDYGISPLMISAKPGFIWPYDNPNNIRIFSAAIPLIVLADECHSLTICLWYISPLQPLNDSADTQFALLGEWNKWTAVSQQRFKSIVTDTKKHEATITIEGVSGEIVSVVVFHSVLQSIIVNCSITATNVQAHVIITPSNVVCS